jgi:hypothetical protein
MRILALIRPLGSVAWIPTGSGEKFLFPYEIAENKSNEIMHPRLAVPGIVWH